MSTGPEAPPAGAALPLFDVPAPAPAWAGDAQVPGSDAVETGLPADDLPETEGDPETDTEAAGEAAAPRVQPRGWAFPDPAPLAAHGPAAVVALCNQKGGVGKTTTTINLGAALAAFGRRVLLVDFDPQGALSVGLGLNPNRLELTVYNLLMQRGLDPHDVVQPTNIDGLDLLPSNIDLSAAEVQLVSEVGREHTLARVLRPLLAGYDAVLVDCQPSLGLLTVNALAASRYVVVPTECEYFALRGVALLLDTIDKVRDRLNPSLELAGVLPTMYDARTLHAREVLAQIADGFGGKVFRTAITRTVKFPDATVAGVPITAYAPSSAGATQYRDLAREVVARGLVR